MMELFDNIYDNPSITRRYPSVGIQFISYEKYHLLVIAIWLLIGL